MKKSFWDKTLRKESDNNPAFIAAFHDIPFEKELKNMSIEQIAQELNSSQEKSVKYIVLQHALNMRLIKAQNGATFLSAWIAGTLAIGGVIVGFLLEKYMG